jgi:anaerobic selenocysteine-containing dehydrogenase
VALRFRGSDSVVQFGNDFPTTGSGRIELCPESLGPVRYRELVSPYSLALLSPASGRTINSIFGEKGTEALLELSPADAAARDIADGDLVRVFNDLGEVVVKVRCTDDMCAGVASLPKGLWASSTRNGSTANALVPDTLTDIGGGACFNDARVEVERLG